VLVNWFVWGVFREPYVCLSVPHASAIVRGTSSSFGNLLIGIATDGSLGATKHDLHDEKGQECTMCATLHASLYTSVRRKRTGSVVVFSARSQPEKKHGRCKYGNGVRSGKWVARAAFHEP
jgi:hypothetical protein